MLSKGLTAVAMVFALCGSVLAGAKEDAEAAIASADTMKGQVGEELLDVQEQKETLEARKTALIQQYTALPTGPVRTACHNHMLAATPHLVQGSVDVGAGWYLLQFGDAELTNAIDSYTQVQYGTAITQANAAEDLYTSGSEKACKAFQEFYEVEGEFDAIDVLLGAQP